MKGRREDVQGFSEDGGQRHHTVSLTLKKGRLRISLRRAASAEGGRAKSHLSGGI